MKPFQKAFALLLTVLLLLSLAGCAQTPRTPEEDRQQLIAILDEIAANLHPGTAGSSLVSARLTADLIAWASVTRMSKQEAAQVVADWLKDQSPQIRESFRMQVENVQESFHQIAADGASDLLESAGVEKDLSNLSSRLREIVSSILASGGLD